MINTLNNTFKTDNSLTLSENTIPPDLFTKQVQAPQNPAPLKNVQKSGEQEIKDRSGEIWECVDRLPNELGGHIYVFKVKDEFLSNEMIQEKDKEIYPAIEPLCADPRIVFQHIHLRLGYLRKIIEGKEYICLPDAKALQANWEKLQAEDPSLPPLRVLSSPGIASDKEFIKAYSKYDILLSTGKEFFHDSIYHTMPRLLQMAELKEKYAEERNRTSKQVKQPYKKIKKARKIIKEKNNNTFIDKKLIEKLFLILGLATDSLSAFGHTHQVKNNHVALWMQLKWDEPFPAMQGFFNRKFGQINLSDQPFSEVWKEVERLSDL